MTADDRPRTTLAELLHAAEPKAGRRLGGLIERLQAEGHLKELRLDGRPVGSPALASLQVSAVVDDSRRAERGSLFVAVAGEHSDGHDHVTEAVGAGALGSIVERPLPDAPGAQLVVHRSAVALASAAGWWYDDPSRELGVIGITGTDGKTSTAFLAAAAMEAAGLRAGLIGTAEIRIGSRAEANPEHVTTPGALQLQRLLRAMTIAGNDVGVLETTSHGLAAERVGGIAYDAAIFTNLSHEHLEFHGSFEAYRAAKLSLFERLARRGPAKRHEFPRLAVVNRDDPAASLFEAVSREAGARLITYGTDPTADVRATSVEEDARGLRIGAATPGWTGRLDLRLAGRFNVHNALAVVALGVGWDLDPERIREGLQDVPGVPGRMERIDAGQPFGVIVDYAHSPAALEIVLDLVGPVAAARGGGLIAVLGSAGERDTAKRPMMGRIAGERCRLVVVTDEDPRGEDRRAILDDIAVGAEAAGRRRGADLLLIPDRKQAIATAFEKARPGDVVLLAGKGHEQTIIYADGPIPWDERAAALEALAALGYRAG